jgi:hypothetical protein
LIKWLVDKNGRVKKASWENSKQRKLQSHETEACPICMLTKWLFDKTAI